MEGFRSYKPGVEKLLHNLDHLVKIQRGEVVAPLHVSVWGTVRCQLKCEYCCCSNENRGEPDLLLDDFIKAVNVLSKYGTKAIEFSGGGEPLLWPSLHAAIGYSYLKGLKISLITNGLGLRNTTQETLKKLSWIRISVVSMDQLDRVDFEYIPKEVKVSLSYIVSSKVDINALYSFAKNRNLITRIAVPQPSSVDGLSFMRHTVEKFGYPFFFAQKEPGVPLGCYMPWIRAAIDWRGNFLPCPAVMIAEGYKVLDKFKLCHVSELENWLINNRPRDLGFRCKFCNCGKEINDFIYKLTKGCLYSEFV